MFNFALVVFSFISFGAASLYELVSNIYVWLYMDKRRTGISAPGHILCSNDVGGLARAGRHGCTSDTGMNSRTLLLRSCVVCVYCKCDYLGILLFSDGCYRYRIWTSAFQYPIGGEWSLKIIKRINNLGIWHYKYNNIFLIAFSVGH